MPRAYVWCLLFRLAAAPFNGLVADLVSASQRGAVRCVWSTLRCSLAFLARVCVLILQRDYRWWYCPWKPRWCFLGHRVPNNWQRLVLCRCLCVAHRSYMCDWYGTRLCALVCCVRVSSFVVLPQRRVCLSMLPSLCASLLVNFLCPLFCAACCIREPPIPRLSPSVPSVTLNVSPSATTVKTRRPCSSCCACTFRVVRSGLVRALSS
jgi:hypothetical protein